MNKKGQIGAPAWLADGMEHIWLPYNQMQTSLLPQAVAKTDGCNITLADGTVLLDGVSSWWTACHGYNHPHILAAMEKQLATLPHVMFGGLVHEPALTLAKRLCSIAPEGLSRVFFSDSGSTAVEVALKMALQYWQNKGQPSKHRFICFKDGYHGDTLGAMAVSDPEQSMHKAFKNNVTRQYVLEIPTDEYTFAEFEQMVAAIHKQIAAIIIEPLVQGAGGMRFHSADILAEISRICRQYEVLFIVDEVATGFGRTGTMFACDEAGITPDIMCVGKALTGGAIGLAATLAKETIFAAFLSDNIDHAFMHGPTYMANPLACAAANASLDLFENEPRLEQVEAIEAQMQEALAACQDMAGVVDVRVKGAIGVVQLDSENIDIPWLRTRFIEEGVWLRPFGDIVYLTPPFTISPKELKKLTDTIVRIVGEWSARQLPAQS